MSNKSNENLMTYRELVKILSQFSEENLDKPVICLGLDFNLNWYLAPIEKIKNDQDSTPFMYCDQVIPDITLEEYYKLKNNNFKF